MPELPEVETIKRDLEKNLVGKKIEAVEVKVAKLINVSVDEFRKLIIGKKVVDVERRAKILIIELNSGNNLLVHLKMTGQLILRIPPSVPPIRGKFKVVGGGHPIASVDQLPNRFSHLIFTFSDNSQLFFNDVRKFGWIKVLSNKEVNKELEKFGIEPLSKNFTLKEFREILQKFPKRKIKQLLLDQSLIAGIGNIYADESCFYAGILPTRAARTLKEEEIKKLHTGIKKILKLSINKRGTSAENYVDAFGRQGGFVPYLKVYGRRGQKCKRCGGVIKKIKLNGRGTHFCEKCQK
jgi:formamidopyrimidine-DNA glycosylase